MQPLPLRAPGELLRDQQAAIAALVERQLAAGTGLPPRGASANSDEPQGGTDHLSFLADAMDAGTAALFTSHVAWASVMLAKRNVPSADLRRRLELARTAVRDALHGDAGTLAVEFLDAGIAELQSTSDDLPSCLPRGAPNGALAIAYMAALRKGERHLASRLVLDAFAAGLPVRDIYLHIFQPAQREVGRLWQLNQITVAEEHYCTAATQLIMSQLYPHVFASEKHGGTLVATCVAGDLHEIGLRMVTDFFEMDGWNTYFLGASTPAQAVVDAVVQQGAQVLAISATMPSHLRRVEELIRLVRAHSACGDVMILVGGAPFALAPALWMKVGASATARDAEEAVATVRHLVPAR
ncbi:MAG: cobalamin-dependent protein [Vicinamibacterales bacterium]